jgi:tetratricopeptide (TPR) repeat protein
MTPRLDKLTALLDADPNDAFVLYGLAQEHAKLGTDEHHTKAVCYYDRCIASDPSYFYAYYHKAMSQIAMERNGDAAATLRTGLAAAKAGRDQKAIGEIAALLDQIT